MQEKNKSNSRLEGFYKLSIEDRLKLISKIRDLNDKETEIVRNKGYLEEKYLDNMIENVIGTLNLPLGIACNFRINNKDYLIPMVIEEPSVVAAASNAAKIARKNGGFITESASPVMIGQIQLVNVENLDNAKKLIIENKNKILEIANLCDPILIKLGGGAINLELKDIQTNSGSMLIIHLLVNVLDAMGANAVNTMVEKVAPYIEEITGGNVLLRIITNLATKRIAKCTAIFDKDLLGGEEIVDNIIKAYNFALADPYRASTHNKGIMNGIIALTNATGNDSRAIEAGAHAYAAIKSIGNSKYSPLTEFKKDNKGNLVGKLEMPLSLATVGGLTNTHPMVKIVLKILGVSSSKELCEVAVALGLAQNVAALRALVSEGIQKGHMNLHKRKLEKK